MNDRSAEKFYILAAVLDSDERRIDVQAVREDSEFGTESYAWHLSFQHEGHTISSESYSWAQAVLDLYDAAEHLGLLNDTFIVD